MSKKKLMCRIAALGGAICLSLTIFASPAATVSVQAAAPNTGENSPMQEVIEWRFKEVNGMLYRRLYNYTRNVWVGDWEFICRVA